MRLAKAWTAVLRLSIIQKSNLSEKSKAIFYNSTIGLHHIDADYAFREKVKRELHKYSANYIEQILEAESHEKAALWPTSSHL